jgi:glucan 1,3-beta-glucosidase
MGLSNLFAASLLALRLFAPVAAAPAPAPETSIESRQAGGDWWFANIERQGVVPFGKGPDYPVFRNVKDFGAVGDGATDDTAAINAAITEGDRCGKGCDSSTNTPAIVYFPPGTYVVSTPIIPYYYTHMVGDLSNPPTIKAAANFAGMAVIDANPYNDDGSNWFTNQNNFFRQVRNFVIDLTGLPASTGTGIHWQVAQATSLQNIVFNMVEDRSEANAQQGLFIDNGSGGFMTDLTFNGGKFGAFVGSQQFTLRNMKFNNCNTAIYMNWNWVWILHGFEINNCGIGLDMTAGMLDGVQTVGSILLVDSTISNTDVGVATTYSTDSAMTNGTLVLDNVDMSTVPVAVKNLESQETILAGNGIISSWVQGRVYEGADGGKAFQGEHSPLNKPEALTDGSGRFVTKSKPQYADVPAANFVSVKAAGAKGDGQTDDTAAIQAVFDNIGADQVVYFDHGAYVITDTVDIPANVRVVGEIWPLIMAGGDANFKDQANPKPMLRVGKPGDVGNVEMSDLRHH